MPRWLAYTVALVALAACGDVAVVQAPPALPGTTSVAPIVGAEPAKPAEIAAWIVDAAGRPVEGVAITIAGEPAVAATSEADGAVRLAASSGDRTLRLDAPHVFPAEALVKAGAEPPRILVTRRVHLEAMVTRDGAAVAGAEVSVSDGAHVAVAASDAAGVARFDDLVAGPYEIWARHGRAVSPLVRTLRDGVLDPGPVALALAPGGAVHGRVLSSDGGAMPPGTTVALVPLDVDHAVRPATLDAAGAFAIDGVPRGRWRLEAEAPGFFREEDDLVEVGGAEVHVDVHLVRGGVVTGTVVDMRGAPVRNATLVLRDQGAGQRTRPVAAVSSRLRWIHPLAGPHRAMPPRAFSRFGAARPGTRPAECGRGHCGVDLPGARGTIVHAAADGEVVAVVREIRKESGRFVVIEHRGGMRTHYLHLDTIRDDLDVGQIVVAGEAIGTVGRTGVVKNVPHLHFALSQERDGRSFYVDAEPMLRNSVVLAEAGTLDAGTVTPTVIAEARDGGTPAAATAAQRLVTDATGAFRIEGVSPGDYVAAAFHVDLAPGISDPFAVRAGELSAGVRIMLTPGAEIRGRVLGRGTPVAYARIVVEEGIGETSHKVATAFTNIHGDYVLRAVAGKVTLLVTAPAYGSAERALDVDGASREVRREDFDLVIEDARLFGDVVDGDGLPVAGASVRVVDGPTLRRRAVTDSQGRFLIAPVAPGDYTVELSSPDFPATRVDLPTDRSKRIALEPGGSIRIDLRDAHTSAALTRIQLELTGPGDRVLRPITDGAGLALVRGLTPGRWTVHARAAGYTAGEQTVEVRAGRTPVEVRLDLARGALVAGIVRDSYGRRVSGAKVRIGDAETRTDDDGNFRIADAPTGSVTIEASLEDSTGSLDLELRPGDELVTLTIDLAE